MEKSSAEISVEIDELEKELVLALQSQERVDTEENLLSRQILELRLKKKDIENAQSKGKHNIRAIHLQIKQKEREFWSVKNSGR